MSSYRQASFSFGPPLTPMVKKLIIVTSAAFLLTYVPLHIFNSEIFDLPYAWFALQPDLVIHRFFVWQLVTYLFLHGGWFHIIFNMFALWMFGADLEAKWGSRKFLFYYFLTGVGAGILDVTLNALFRPEIFPTG
jgi:membrane associated rhomboid family serine protease